MWLKVVGSIKSLIVDNLMQKISQKNMHDEIKLQEIKYGLEAIYLNLSKFIVFFTINAILGNFILGLLFFVFFGPIKSTSYGFHAKTSFQCWIISAIGFIGLPLLANYINFNIHIKIILIFLALISFYLWAPADTPKRPLVNKKKRIILKIGSLLITLIYSVLIIFYNQLAPIIILVLFYQIILINPLTYFIFNIQYNNYLYYKLN